MQLRSSGSLCLIRNEQAVDSIISYQNMVELIMTNQEDERSERNKAYEVAMKMFNPLVFDRMVKINGIEMPTDNPPLRSYDRNLQLDLAGYAHTLKGSTYLLTRQFEILNNRAKKLIVLLKKEYDLE